MTNKKILFIAKKSSNAATRYRALQYFPYFETHGWQPLHIIASSSPKQWLNVLRQAKQVDAVVVVRKLFAKPLLFLLRLFARKLIFDFDDAIFVNDDGSFSKQRQRGFCSVTKSCDYTWAGNSYLAEQAKKYCENTTIIPTAIEHKRYALEAAKPTDYFDLVWVGSSATKKYLQEILPTLEAIGKKFPDVRLKIIADFDLATNHIQVIPIQWSASTEVKEIASSHVGIAPMIDNAWTRGKCALKVIQYMAAGLPVISSAASANKDIVLDGITGFLVNDQASWLNAVQQLKENSSLRHNMGMNGQQRVTEHYSVEKTFEKMLKLLT